MIELKLPYSLDMNNSSLGVRARYLLMRKNQYRLSNWEKQIEIVAPKKKQQLNLFHVSTIAELLHSGAQYRGMKVTSLTKVSNWQTMFS
jgi:hypothetical protein